MVQIGIDIGSSALRICVMQDEKITGLYERKHLGRPMAELCKLVREAEIPEVFCLGITGTKCGMLTSGLGGSVEEIPAMLEGAKQIGSQAGSVIEIGFQGSYFLTNLDGVPQFSANGHCAGGTGSFFEDQMSRIGMKIEDYSQVVSQATQIPRLSGRCSVFAKTDIIHRQQEGTPTPDILLGLCYAMIRNFKATIVRKLPVKKPVLICGGVTRNAGVLRAIRDVFSLEAADLLVPQEAVYLSAIGAAMLAKTPCSKETLLNAAAHSRGHNYPILPKLQLPEGVFRQEPMGTGILPDGGCSLGIDIGSTSTDLVIVGVDGSLVDYQYLRTAGNPEKAVREGLASIRARFGEISFRAVGITGSGRERLGKMLGADAIIDEITAQAQGAYQMVSDVDTVFEIGGQDSKFIRLHSGQVTDFQMNKICAAGTGSFVEEQAVRSGIPIGEFGSLAMQAEAPIDLGQRCTVFMETAIADAAAEGVETGDIAAGLCYSVVKNYLQKTVGNHPVGDRIVLQGGVAYNPAIVAAFCHFYGEKLTVNPYFPISGAYGVAKLAQSQVQGKSKFTGFDFETKIPTNACISREIQENIAFYRRANELLVEGYDGSRDPNRKTVGVPYVLMIHKFFPMANAFFKSLGFNVLLTNPTDEETVALSQSLASGETCYPVKLIYGHMKQLMDAGVDYIFLPSIHTMKHEKSKVSHNYGCVYMQTAAQLVGKSLNLEALGIKFLSPVFDLDFGQEAMVSAMVGLGKELGIAKPFCAKALLSGAMAVRKHTAAVEAMGKQLLSSIAPTEKVMVLITRNYGVSDPILNMGIPELLLKRGCKVITLSHLPAHDLDISEDHPNLYWPFGQHILSGAKIIASHPNLYAVYLTNHGCGPDTMLSHLFRQEMGDKPYLQIEVDEHFSAVGVVTRIEAFLNSLKAQPVKAETKEYALKDVPSKTVSLPERPTLEKPLYLPPLGIYTEPIAQYCQEMGVCAEILQTQTEEIVSDGRPYTQSKEYLTFTLLVGFAAQHAGKIQNGQLLIPQTAGAEADGQYARVIKGELPDLSIVAPKLETFWKTADEPDALLRAVVLGDLLTNAPKEVRMQPHCETSWEALSALAEQITTTPASGKQIGIVGTPLCQAVLHDDIPLRLEEEGYLLLTAPLSEYLLMLWAENGCPEKRITYWAERLEKLGQILRNRGSLSTDFQGLADTANRLLPHFNGGNGRYRCAKAVELSRKCSAVLTLAPRYENTDMVLQMLDIPSHCSCPVYPIALDHDFDESAWSQLHSFLYYC